MKFVRRLAIAITLIPESTSPHCVMKTIRSISTLLWACLATALAFADPPIQPGDRIAIVGNTFADQLRIHGYLETLLLQQSLEKPVSVRNLGWGGDMLTARDRPTGFPSEESTLRDHQTDVIIACFGMGESFGGEEGLQPFQEQLRTFIASHSGKKYNGKSEVRLILVSPIACEDHGALTPARDKRNRDLQSYTLAMRDVAADAGVPFVDLFEPSLYLMDEPVGPKLTTNGIHLTPYGYWAISHSFCGQLIGRPVNERAWLIRIDAAAKTSDATGVVCGDLTSHNSGLRFEVVERVPPKLPPPSNSPLPPQLAFVRDTLIVVNLAEGKHQLTIDGEPIATATAKQWSEGVAIDNSPAHKSIEAFRAAVNDKNLQYTYSWKALNQVHIVGERKQSPSGRALPGEVIEFLRIAKERAKGLGQGTRLKTRVWKLLPVE